MVTIFTAHPRRTGGDRTIVDTANTNQAVAARTIRLVLVTHCLLKVIILNIKKNRDFVRKIPKVMGQSGVRGNKEIED